MIEIDGSRGGGQILRTSLTLSALTGKDFRMENVRGSRPSPGLKPQHLKSVEAVKKLCNASVEGMKEGGRELVFRPEELRPESFTVNIGTAGSTTLLLDAVLPLTSQVEDEIRITAKGGTDVKWSPPFHYLSEVKIPLLKQSGFRGEIDLERTGFYPAGGGVTELRASPHSLQTFELEERGELERFKIYSRASKELEGKKVAERQAEELAKKLKNHSNAELKKNVSYVDTDSTGSVLVLKSVYDSSIAGFSSLGERGKRSEKLSDEVFRSYREFSGSEAAVDRKMADQLIVYLALSRGRVAIPEVTDHVQTSIETVKKFGYGVDIVQEGGSTFIENI